MSRDRYLLRREPDGGPSRNRFTASSTLSSVADPDPGSDAFVTPGFGIRCPGWVKKPDPDPRFGSGMNNPDHISESVETIFYKILKLFDVHPGWKKFASATLTLSRRISP